MSTRIEWTQSDDGTPGMTWNPTTGCDRVSPGCDNCYALTLAKRLKGMGSAKYQNDGDPRTSGPGFGVTEHPDTLDVPRTWRKPRRVFVNSMSDLFHEKISSAFIAAVFDVMRETPQHTYQILTKRHARMRSLARGGTFGEGWPLANVHLGVSVEDQKRAELRIPVLLDTPAIVRFLSCEPLIGPVTLSPFRAASRGLEWVIIGGESGPRSRPCDPDWIRNLIRECQEMNIPVFVKQLGSVWARDNGWGGKGGLPEQWPEDWRIREFPATQAVTG